MRPYALLCVLAPAAAHAAAQQHVLSQPSSVVSNSLESTLIGAVFPESVNMPSIRTTKRLATAAAEKPAMEASLLGLIVFSAAGLFLL